jgi:hypothetical protein
MKNFYASDNTSVEYCQKSVQECDVYVGVIGPLYGSCPSSSKISFTQHEYEASVTKRIPRLIFLTRDDFPIPDDLRESDANHELQQKFRQRIRNECMVKFFDDPRKLGGLVIGSLTDLQEKTEDPTSPSSTTSHTEPNLGPSVHELCDRGPQEDAFTSFFRQIIREMPRVPHIYILHGEERENLDSLIDRFCRCTIEKQLIPQLNLPRESVACRLVEWPDPDSAHPEEALARRLFAKIAEDEPYPMLEAATFVNLRLLTVGGMLALKHEIREKRWTAKVLRLIDWYCRFWDEVAAHNPMRQLMVFLSILYPAGTKVHGWKSLLRLSAAFGRVERDLIELQNRRQRETERNPRMCPIARLPEVCCVRDRHLMEWFSAHHICELHERECYRQHIFVKRDCVHMAHLEPELKKIVITWRKKGYAA